MVISFNPRFNIGDQVYAKVDPEIKMIVLAFYVMNVDENGNVLHYNIDCGFGDGTMKSFRPFELDLLEKVDRANG